VALDTSLACSGSEVHTRFFGALTDVLGVMPEQGATRSPRPPPRIIESAIPPMARS
jgi:hypothetical protein